MRTWKWIVGALFGIALAGALLVINLPSILMRYPELLGVLARLRDPIGPSQEVTWQPGPIDRTRADPHRPGEEFAYWPN